MFRLLRFAFVSGRRQRNGRKRLGNRSKPFRNTKGFLHCWWIMLPSATEKQKTIYRNKWRQKKHQKNPSSIDAVQKKVLSRQKPLGLFNRFMPKRCSQFDNLHCQNVAAFDNPLLSVDKTTRRLFDDKVQKTRRIALQRRRCDARLPSSFVKKHFGKGKNFAVCRNGRIFQQKYSLLLSKQSNYCIILSIVYLFVVNLSTKQRRKTYEF